MKFTFKIIISVITIISIIFSIAGVTMCKQNFTHSLENTINQNIDNHLLIRYGIENNTIENIDENGAISDKKIIEYARNLILYLENNKNFSIYSNNNVIYSNLEIDLTDEDLNFLNNSKQIKYLLKDINNKRYMIIGSSLEINTNKITFLSEYDITDVFIERDRQIKDFCKIDISIIVISLITIGILSIFLTKPIIKLNELSKEIAKGKYDERIHINSNDEIGELSESFNIMIEAVENKIKELELLIKQREDFITNFNHELKNPMTSIIGYADILRSNKYDYEVKIRAANYIFNEGKRLEVLARKLMDLMELSNENIKFEKIDITNFASKISNDLKDNLGEIELEVNIEEAKVLGDKSLLEDCIRNLIDNSKKANPKDNKIIFLGKKQNEKYCISIIDKGVGIPEEDLPKVQDCFYMVDKMRAKNNGRNGVGLSLCKKIAEIHGSNLEIESVLGQGTKVSIYLEVVKNEK